jgi:hypothetical protein
LDAKVTETNPAILETKEICHNSPTGFLTSGYIVRSSMIDHIKGWSLVAFVTIAIVVASGGRALY